MSPNVEHAAAKDPPTFGNEADNIDPAEYEVDMEPQMSSSPVHTPVMEHEAFGPISPVIAEQEVLY